MAHPGKNEFSWLAIGLGILIAIVLTAANVYLGLYAGMTVSASIPAAVVAMGVFKALGKNNIYHSNIVQTMASAGESLAAGIIFTIPALVLVGAWNNFQFWPTMLIGSCGGMLGVLFMVPLRSVLIVKRKDLTYPEGVACAVVLKAGVASERETSSESQGLGMILKGLGLGALFKVCQTGLGLLHGTVEWAGKAGSSVFFIGSDISPALLAIGYIVRLHIAVLVFLGGVTGWVISIPFIGIPASLQYSDPLNIAWTLWSTKVRYMGVGAMIVGGIWSIISVRKGLWEGITTLWTRMSVKTTNNTTASADLSLPALVTLLITGTIIMLLVYQYLLQNISLTVLVTILMVLACFIFAAVSSYITGLVGSSNNPVSGMTISALLGTALLFVALGLGGESAILATLGVAAVVCCAACTAGDCSQDLKTGAIIGATPRYQQWAQIVGIVIPALIIAPVLTLLHSSYGIGTGLKAPQATLFASIVQGIFGAEDLPYRYIWIGIGLGIGILVVDQVLGLRNTSFRLHVMPVAVGIYLPVTLAIPIIIGGLIRYGMERQKNPDKENIGGVLLCSGLIAGEALMGVILALFIYFNLSYHITWLSTSFKTVVSLAAFAGLVIYLHRAAQRIT